MKDLLLGLALVSCPAIVFLVFGTSGLETFGKGAEFATYSTPAQNGRLAFAEECSGCHGRLANGSDRGPDLVHANYGPARLDDDTFRRAVREGTTARLGGFGAMPPVPGVSDRKLDSMLAFVRELQRVNGIR